MFGLFRTATPMNLRIADPKSSLSASNAMPTVAVGTMGNSLIRTQGITIRHQDVGVHVIGCYSNTSVAMGLVLRDACGYFVKI